MDTQDIRARSSGTHTNHDDGNAPRQYGVNWPFPINGELKVWTAKQRKQYKAKQLADAPEAPF